jgi:hypothetical protein
MVEERIGRTDGEIRSWRAVAHSLDEQDARRIARLLNEEARRSPSQAAGEEVEYVAINVASRTPNGAVTATENGG